MSDAEQGRRKALAVQAPVVPGMRDIPMLDGLGGVVRSGTVKKPEASTKPALQMSAPQTFVLQTPVFQTPVLQMHVAKTPVLQTSAVPKPIPQRPATPIEPAVPVKFVTPIESTISLKPATQIGLVTAIEPTRPIEPTLPIEPATPIQPATPLQPAIQIQYAAPKPATPIKPAAPVKLLTHLAGMHEVVELSPPLQPSFDNSFSHNSLVDADAGCSELTKDDGNIVQFTADAHKPVAMAEDSLICVDNKEEQGDNVQGVNGSPWFAASLEVAPHLEGVEKYQFLLPM